MAAWRGAVLLVVLVGCGEVELVADGPRGADASSDGAGGDSRPADAPAGAKIVFVTSQGHQATFGSLAGADAICQGHAEMFGLSGTYLAWLSDGSQTGSPAGRFTRNPGPYVLVDNTIVANSWTDLTDGSINTPINVDERGILADGGLACSGGLDVWSATREDGSPGPGLNVCASGGTAWTPTNATDTGAVGYFAIDSTWTLSGCVANCFQYAPLYCFQQ